MVVLGILLALAVGVITGLVLTLVVDDSSDTADAGSDATQPDDNEGDEDEDEDEGEGDSNEDDLSDEEEAGPDELEGLDGVFEGFEEMFGDIDLESLNELTSSMEEMLEGLVDQTTTPSSVDEPVPAGQPASTLGMDFRVTAFNPDATATVLAESPLHATPPRAGHVYVQVTIEISLSGGLMAGMGGVVPLDFDYTAIAGQSEVAAMVGPEVPTNPSNAPAVPAGAAQTVVATFEVESGSAAGIVLEIRPLMDGMALFPGSAVYLAVS